MANLETTVELVRMERAGATSNGNPKWIFWTTEGRWLLQSDANIGYALDNKEYRDMCGQRVVFSHTKAGRVFNLRLAPDQS